MRAPDFEVDAGNSVGRKNLWRAISLKLDVDGRHGDDLGVVSHRLLEGDV